MPSLDESYSRLVAALADFYGQPASRSEPDSPFAAVIAAGLNRDAARPDHGPLIAALDRAGLLEPRALAATVADEVRDALQEAGITLSPFRALLLVRLAQWYAAAFPDDREHDDKAPSTTRLRKQLARINGVGPATAQSILLALGRSAFPLDRGIYRILVRHGWIDSFTDADEFSQTLCRLAGDDCHEIDRLAPWLAQVGASSAGPGGQSAIGVR